MRYLPHTDREVAVMLERLGIADINALFASVPSRSRSAPLKLEPALDELSLMGHLETLAARNQLPALSFLGAGSYDHHIPPAVDQLLLRSEFYTAYTPYQPEVAQGTLQAMFEFQTIVCELFGMEVANASLYDGASGTAEAALMARRVTGRPQVVVSAGVHPEYRATLETYLSSLAGGGESGLIEVPLTTAGTSDLAALSRVVDAHTAAVVVAFPNFLGSIEDLRALASVAHERGALLVVANSEPYAFGVLEAPGAVGADIVVGEGQALAVPPQFGGPGVGLFACRQRHIRQVPGRIVGQTTDQAGQRGFVLTLSTREQHIRRDRATSNICTNHGLVALALTIRVALLGRQGYRAVAQRCLDRAEYFKARVRDQRHLSLPHDGATFNEVTVRFSGKESARNRLAALADQGILAGVPLDTWFSDRSNDALVAFTERHARADIDRLVAALEAT